MRVRRGGGAGNVSAAVAWIERRLLFVVEIHYIVEFINVL
jgi:hypothetical protein